MSEKNTLVRSLHDVGLAAWFGSSLMGAVGVNGAAAAAHDPTERLRLAGVGWKKWQPFDAAAVGAHLVGGTGLLAANKARLATQPGSRVVTVAKTALTGVAVGLSAYNKRLGQRAGRHSDEGPRGHDRAGLGVQPRARRDPAPAARHAVGPPGRDRHPRRARRAAG